MPFMIVAREAWTTYKSTRNFQPVRLPVSKVLFIYTNKDYSTAWAKKSPGPRPDYKECQKELKYLLKGDMGLYKDIRYNFMLGSDGAVFEGRGWHTTATFPSAYVKYKDDALFVAFLGDFKDEPPSQEQLNLRDEFLKFGVRNNYITPKFLSITCKQPRDWVRKMETVGL